MQIIQISSGKGPLECEMAVGKYLEVFLSNHNAKIIKKINSSYLDIGNVSSHCFKSVLLEVDEDEKVKLGSVKWICQSPFRKNHKRKNWFIEISKIKENRSELDLDLKLLKYQTFRSSGKGGQNVNKVETGARVIHVHTGITATSTSARTQLQNKKIATNRLLNILNEMKSNDKKTMEQNIWIEHERIERGNPFEIYVGIEFLKK